VCRRERPRGTAVEAILDDPLVGLVSTNTFRDVVQ
jgi:hypothetical protein